MSDARARPAIDRASLPQPIDCVLFDLDDTLYDHLDFLRGALAAAAAAAHHTDPARRALLRAALLDVVREQGTDDGPIFERALANVGAPVDAATLERMADAFRAHAPEHLAPAPGALELLAALGARWPLGLVTDGEVEVQRAKLRALGLEHWFAVVVYSDALGGPAARKPDSRPFQAALDALGGRAAHAVYVGDHPGRDVAGARALGLTTIRVLTGEHAGRPVAPAAEADFTVDRMAAVRDLLL